MRRGMLAGSGAERCRELADLDRNFRGLAVSSGLPGGSNLVDYRTGLVQDHDASVFASITDAGGGAVSAWADQSGTGKHVSQGTGARRPTYTASAGSIAKPAITFSDAAATSLENTTTDLIAAGGACTTFIVMHGTNATGGTFIRRRLASLYQTMQLYNLFGVSFVSGDGVNGAQNCQMAQVDPSTVARLISFEWSGVGNAPVVEINGVAQTVTAGVQGTENGTTGFDIGYNGSAQGFTGHIYTVRTYDDVLSGANKDIVDAFLMGTWGVV